MSSNVKHNNIPSCLTASESKPHIPGNNELSFRLLIGSCALLPRARSASREIASILAPHLNGQKIEVTGDIRYGDHVCGVRVILDGPRINRRRAGFEIISGTVLAIGEGKSHMLTIEQEDGSNLRIASTTLCAYPVLINRPQDN